MGSESSVSVATLTAGGELGHRGTRERMSEGESPIRIDPHQPRSLGGTEPLQVHLPGGGLQDAEIPGAIEDGQQEQVARRCGQPGDSRREDRLEAFAEGQGLRRHRGRNYRCSSVRLEAPREQAGCPATPREAAGAPVGRARESDRPAMRSRLHRRAGRGRDRAVRCARRSSRRLSGTPQETPPVWHEVDVRQTRARARWLDLPTAGRRRSPTRVPSRPPSPATTIPRCKPSADRALGHRPDPTPPRAPRAAVDSILRFRQRAGAEPDSAQRS